MKKIIAVLLVMVMLCFCGGCNKREKEEYSYTLEIKDKVIDYEKGSSSVWNYYFVLDKFGMVEVSLNEYNSYMIGDMYTYTFYKYK